MVQHAHGPSWLVSDSSRQRRPRLPEPSKSQGFQTLFHARLVAVVGFRAQSEKPNPVLAYACSRKSPEFASWDSCRLCGEQRLRLNPAEGLEPANPTLHASELEWSQEFAVHARRQLQAVWWTQRGYSKLFMDLRPPAKTQPEENHRP